MLPRVTRDPVMLQTLDMRQGVWAIDPIAGVMKKRERKVLSRPTMVKRFFTRSTGILPVGQTGILPVYGSTRAIGGKMPTGPTGKMPVLQEHFRVEQDASTVVKDSSTKHIQ